MIVTLLILFIFSFSGTGCLRYYALANNVLDVPNHRSSHVIPTPRGGGIAFVIVFIIYLIYQGHFKALPWWTELGLVVGGSGIAFLGFVDDHIHISAKHRLLAHFTISSFALYCLGGMPSLSFLGWTFPQSVLLNFLALFYLVWFLNLFNFMDGINGLAAIEAICICLGGVFLYLIQQNHEALLLPLAMATVVGSFLCWNFPKARIFMGDAGSGFLGLIIGLFSIQAAQFNNNLFWGWLILSGAFIVDATITLLFRVIEGQPLSEGHRTHAYQCAADLFHSHFKVTLIVLSINLLWLFPFALLVACDYLPGIIGLVITYCPLILLVIGIRTKRNKAIN